MKTRIIILGISLFVTSNLYAARFDYRNRSGLSPSDYLMGSNGEKRDPVFDNYKTIDLSVDLGIGSDCGQINFKNTLKAGLQNMLDAKYFGSLGKNIVAGSPMLLTCYFSPTWCAILKHFQLQSSYLAQMRLDQCAIIDKYVDSRVEDFYEERQRCVQKEIQKTGGNFEEAIDKCKNTFSFDLKNWSGDRRNPEVSENRLIEASASWAGFKGADAKRTVSLVKALIGDTVIRKGNIQVDYGPKKIQFTPRTYLLQLERESFQKLCGELVPKVMKYSDRASLQSVVSKADLKKLSGQSETLLIDRQTLRSLSLLPDRKRAIACQKLSDAMAMTIFSNDMSQSLDFVSAKMGTNPHLPDHRRQEVETKRRALKDQIEMTMSLYRHKNEPLNEVLYQINSEGLQFQNEAIERRFENDSSARRSQKEKANFFDCADDVMCE